MTHKGLPYLINFFIISICSMLYIPGHAQGPQKFYSYSNKEGFNQNTILSIERDINGFFWLGTSHGLYSFDGYDFQNLTNQFGDISIAYQNRIKYIHHDSQGLLWIISQDGLYAYHPEYEKIYRIFTESSRKFNKIVEDSANLWLLGENYLSKLSADIQSDTILFNPGENIISGNEQDLLINDAVIEKKHLILGTNRGVYYLPADKNYVRSLQYHTTTSSQMPAVITKVVRLDDVIWLGSENGLYKTVLDNERLHILESYRDVDGIPNSISDNYILDIYPEENGDLWIGTENGGLSFYNSRTNDFNNYLYDAKNPYSISSSRVNCIYKDEFDVLWLGTAQGGLCKFDLNQKQFHNIVNNPFENNTISGNLINNILEDSKGNLWISSYMNPLSKSTGSIYDTHPSNIKFKRFQKWYSKHPDKNVLSLFEDNRGYIWIGYQNSLVVYDPDTDEFIPVNLFENGNPVSLVGVQKILHLDHNKLLVAGTSLTIIEDPWRYINRNAETKIPVSSNYTLKMIPDYRNNIISVLIDDKDRLWAGTRNNGIFIFELFNDQLSLSQRFLHLPDSGSLSNNAIFSLYQDREGYIWIGTFGGGINKIHSDDALRENNFQYIGIKEGLPDNAVYGIIEEDDSTIWISTDVGLCRINTRQNRIMSYNINNGLSSNNFRLNAYFAGNSGYFYFGGLNGLTMFQPDKITSNQIPPKILIADLKINNKGIKADRQYQRKLHLNGHISKTSDIRILPNMRTVSFDILVQQSSSPQKNSILYMLEGFDNDWIKQNAGKYTATYTNLPPGDYVFKARAFNGDGIVSEKPVDLNIHVIAPWYKRWWSYTLFGLLILGIAYTVSWYFIKYEKLQQNLVFEQKDKQRIQQVNQSKLRFFTNVSHEIRTPLSLISAPIQLLEKTSINHEQKRYLSIIDKNTKRLMNLVDQLLIFRKIDQGYIKLKLSAVTLTDFFYPIAEAFEALSLKRNINFSFKLSKGDKIVVLDYEKMERVIFNLLSNAFKFTPENGDVHLEARIEQKNEREVVVFDIKDNGRGIPKSEINKIFERFYQADTEFNDVGTGIGLSVSKSIVDLHNGSIEVKSIPGKETCFAVTVPVVQDDIFVPERVEVKKPTIEELIGFDSINDRKAEIENVSTSYEYSVLIVDDERDFRDLLKNVLSDHYNLFEAKNAGEAFELISSQIPDLIISDVMMPGMNGYTFCHKIKSNIEYCHIPVILLTALGDMDMRIKGVEFGADAYYTKPFHVEQLLVSVQKLIENRKRIKEHFSKSYNLSPDIKLSSYDEKFVLSVNEIIEKNIDNSSFGVVNLASEVNLSTSQFYRKLKLLTGQIPNAYIRNYRLQRAADIIEANPGISIKNVMFDVGIESASYFSHSFKKKFGVLPSEYPGRSVKTG